MSELLTREEKKNIIIEAIKSQPFEPHFIKDETAFNSSYSSQTLEQFVEETWVGSLKDDLFIHVAERILHHLEKAESNSSRCLDKE